MKKFLALSILAVSIGATAVSAEAKTSESSNSSTIIATSASANAAAPQTRWQRQNWRRVRVVNRTRIIRIGFRTYREVVQYRYLPNGRVNTRVISRVRIR
jgi:hypothetical protein